MPDNQNNQGDQLHISEEEKHRLLHMAADYANESFTAKKIGDEEYSRRHEDEALVNINTEINMLLQKNRDYDLHMDKAVVEKLKLQRERNLSQMLLNSSRALAWWDSPEMTAVKDSVAELEQTLTGQRIGRDRSPVRDKEIRDLIGKYQTAITECRKYVETKTTKTGTARYLAVRNKMESLMTECSEFESLLIQYDWREVGGAKYAEEDSKRMPTLADFLIYHRVADMKGRIRHTKSADYDRNTIGKKGRVDLPQQLPKDTAAQLVLKLLTGNLDSLRTDDSPEHTTDNVRIAESLLDAITNFKQDGGIQYFHSATMVSAKLGHTSRKYVDAADRKTKRCNILFALKQDKDGKLFLTYSEVDKEPRTIELGGRENVMVSMCHHLMAQETWLNENYQQGKGTEATDMSLQFLKKENYTLSEEDAQDADKRKQHEQFEGLADNVISMRCQGVQQDVLDNATAEQKRQAVVYLLDHKKEKKQLKYVKVMELLGAGVEHYACADDTLEAARAKYADEAAFKAALVSYLSKVTGLPANLIEHKTVEDLHAKSCAISKMQMSPRTFIRQIAVENHHGKKAFFVETADMKYINTKETRRLMLERKQSVDKQRYIKDKVVFKQKVQRQNAINHEEGPAWTAEQTAVKNFISELLYGHDTWEEDFLKDNQHPDPEQILMDRYARMLANPENAKAMAYMLKDPDLLKNTLAQIPFMRDYNEDGTQKPFDEQKIVKPLEGAIKSLVADSIDTTKEVDAVAQDIRNMYQNELRNGRQLKLKERVQASDIQFQSFINEMTTSRIENINKLLKRKIGEQFNAAKRNVQLQKPASWKEKGLSEEEIKERIKAENKYLMDLRMQNNLTGDTDQAKFIREVLEKYFEQITDKDQRSVMAYMFREARPTGEQGQEEEERESNIQKSEESCLAGMIKGAGPLLQKLLQGLQMDGVPSLLRNAMVDVRSNLHPIQQEVVEAQLAEQVRKSHGTIERIEIEKSLGAASIGQAFLGKIVLPKPEGAAPQDPNPTEEVVIKVLRPDVETRLKREEQIIANIAKSVSSSMQASYDGVVRRIYQELDLTLEAKNVEKGQKHYDPMYTKEVEGRNQVKSMQLSKRIEPTKDLMVLKKADGITLDRYLSNIEAQLMQRYQGMLPLKDGKIDQEKYQQRNGALYGIIRRDQLMDNIVWVSNTVEEMAKRRDYLMELTRKWYEQALYDDSAEQGKFFFHGDLHSGNIMLDEDGATIIDYGNATSMTLEQKQAMLRIVAAAGAGQGVGNAKDGTLIKSIETLLNTLEEGEEKQHSQENFKNNRQNLTDYATEIFAIGDGQTTMLRVALLFDKAQSYGIAMPPAVANFIQAQLRLQNSVDSYTTLIETMRMAAEASARKAAIGDFAQEYGLDVEDITYKCMRNYSKEQEQMFKDCFKDRLLVQFTKNSKFALERNAELFANTEEAKKTFEAAFLPDYVKQDPQSEALKSYYAFREAQSSGRSEQDVKACWDTFCMNLKLEVNMHQDGSEVSEDIDSAIPENVTTYLDTFLNYTETNEKTLSTEGKVVDTAECVAELKKYFGKDYNTPIVQNVMKKFTDLRGQIDPLLQKEELEEQEQRDLQNKKMELFMLIQEIQCVGMMSFLNRLPQIRSKQTKGLPEGFRYDTDDTQIVFSREVADVITDHLDPTLEAIGRWWALINGMALQKNFRHE